MTTPRSDDPGVLVCPPLLYGLALLVGIALLVPPGTLSPCRSRIAGIMLLGSGMALARWGEETMRRAGINIHFTRNALYGGDQIFPKSSPSLRSPLR
jgi:hypothetical protein